MDNYLKALKKDKDITLGYYKSSLTKNEQQKALERLLGKRPEKRGLEIADIACGGGTLSYHLNNIYKKSRFTLLDKHPGAIKTARSINGSKNFKYYVDDIYRMPFKKASFDLVFCWQTLSYLNRPQRALDELIRICRPGGKIYASSLFNLDFDVDIYADVYDYTRNSARAGICLGYNTYSLYTVRRWLKGKVRSFKIVKFNPEIDLFHSGKGLGTFTKRLGKERLQVSGGMLLNWGILIVKK